jgi:RimJ/RimL family protein N-acetyltransferase
LEFRVVGPRDAQALAEIFADVDETFFRPHPFTSSEALYIANHVGKDVYAILLDGERPVAYGMLRGWEEGFATPSLGIAVRTAMHGQGLGRLMMAHLHAEALRRGAIRVRLRVHRENVRARRLYESIGYQYAGEDRGELVMLFLPDTGSDTERVLRPTRGDMAARVLDVDAPEWASILSKAPHDFYHLPAYGALCADHEHGVAKALYVEDGKWSMLLPFIVRHVPGSDREDASSPYGYPGPVTRGTDDPGFQSRALVAGIAALRAVGIVSLFVRLHPVLNPSPPEGIGVVVRHADTISIDLTLPPETLYAQMRHNHRRDIQRALRHGLRARMDRDWQHYGAFKRLYGATMNRRTAAQFYYFGDEFFDGLRAALGERLHLCVVLSDDAVAAAGLFVETNGIVQFHLAGWDEAFAQFQPAKLMLHFVIGWAKERGNHNLHLGGGVGGADDSLLYFKSGFSPRRYPFHTLRVVIDEQEYRRLVSARDPALDPDEPGGFFPAYRTPWHGP